MAKKFYLIDMWFVYFKKGDRNEQFSKKVDQWQSGLCNPQNRHNEGANGA